ncbi:MAG TPA: DUF4410 domain-containing protein [Verrucomicrobiota bacterium]|nr:DUF4410 domain-containing protein [Verrucomicrobiota bacterium]
MKTLLSFGRISSLGLCVVATLLATGCASTKVTNQQPVSYGKLPRPGQVWVYPFVASGQDLPSESALAGNQELDTTPPSAEDVALGQKLGSEVAAHLVQDIQDMGMPAMVGSPATKPAVNDIVLHGYFISIKQGSGAKRFLVGFGSGSSELKTVMEGFQMTPTGLRKLGQGEVSAEGSKGPGAAVGVGTFLLTHNPAGLIISSGLKVYGEASGRSKVEGRADATAKEIAKVLKVRFQEQGWIPAD